MKFKIAISVFIILVLALMFTGWIDDTGREYTEQGLKRSLVAYGVARGLNGIISVAQGTEVAVEPVGVGMTFTPGQILDPINDLIERFSWIVLASGVSLGAQGVLLNITAWTWFGVLVAGFLLVSLVLLWRDQLISEQSKRIIYKVTLVMVVLRLAVPVIAVINEGLYRVFLEPQYEESIQMLEATTEDIEQIRNESVEPKQEQGMIEKAKQFIENASNALDIDKQFEKLKQSASEISEYALNMIVVFVLQTLIFPLFFLWLTYKLLLRIVAS